MTDSSDSESYKRPEYSDKEKIVTPKSKSYRKTPHVNKSVNKRSKEDKISESESHDKSSGEESKKVMTSEDEINKITDNIRKSSRRSIKKIIFDVWTTRRNEINSSRNKYGNVGRPRTSIGRQRNSQPRKSNVFEKKHDSDSDFWKSDNLDSDELDGEEILSPKGKKSKKYDLYDDEGNSMSVKSKKSVSHKKSLPPTKSQSLQNSKSKKSIPNKRNRSLSQEDRYSSEDSDIESSHNNNTKNKKKQKKSDRKSIIDKDSDSPNKDSPSRRGSLRCSSSSPAKKEQFSNKRESLRSPPACHFATKKTSMAYKASKKIQSSSPDQSSSSENDSLPNKEHKTRLSKSPNVSIKYNDQSDDSLPDLNIKDNNIDYISPTGSKVLLGSLKTTRSQHLTDIQKPPNKIFESDSSDDDDEKNDDQDKMSEIFDKTLDKTRSGSLKKTPPTPKMKSPEVLKSLTKISSTKKQFAKKRTSNVHNLLDQKNISCSSKISSPVKVKATARKSTAKQVRIPIKEQSSNKEENEYSSDISKDDGKDDDYVSGWDTDSPQKNK